MISLSNRSVLPLPLQQPARSVAPQKFGATPEQIKEVFQLGLGKLNAAERGFHWLKSNESFFKFFQDTAILWLPKIVLSRSWVDAFEVSFLEFVESGFFYFAAPILGSFVGAPIYRKLAGLKHPSEILEKAGEALYDSKLKDQLINRKHFEFHSIDELGKLLEKGHIKPEIFKKALSVKAANVIGMLMLTTIAGEYALNFVKNLLTEKFFNVTQFSDVANLNKSGKKKQNKSVSEKAWRRIYQCLAIGGAFTLLGAFIAKRGGHWNWERNFTPLTDFMRLIGQKVFKRNPKDLPEITGKYILERFDFGTKDGSWWSKIDLGGKQTRIIMPIAVLGYWDSARDHLERIESGSRATVTGGYIGFGQELLLWAMGTFGLGKLFGYAKNPATAHVYESEQKSGSLMYFLNNRTLKEKDVLIQEALRKAGGNENKAAELFKDAYRIVLKTKWIPYTFGIVFIGFVSTLMNQIWTKYRHQKEEQAKAGIRLKHPLYVTTHTPKRPILNLRIPQQLQPFVSVQNPNAFRSPLPVPTFQQQFLPQPQYWQ